MGFEPQTLLNFAALRPWEAASRPWEAASRPVGGRFAAKLRAYTVGTEAQVLQPGPDLPRYL